ncbi:MAG: hypothetical protein HY720_33295 [Planctomycetes bacterium]|nr:hypothetical protein [Planctomycetota bacterium]
MFELLSPGSWCVAFACRNLMERFLVEEGIGRDARFWKPPPPLLPFYSAGTANKRRADGVLAGKKGLGFG